MHASQNVYESTPFASRSHLRQRQLVRVTGIAHMYRCAAQGAYDLDCDIYVAFDTRTSSYLIATSPQKLLDAMSNTPRRYAVSRITRRSLSEPIINVETLDVNQHQRYGRLSISQTGTPLKHGRVDGVEVSS